MTHQSKHAQHASPSQLPEIASGSAMQAGTGITIFFYIYLVIEYARPQDTFPPLGAIRPALLSLIVLAIFSLSRLNSEVFRDPSIRLFMLFVGLCWFGVLHATNTYWAFQYSLTMTMHLAAAVLPMCLIVKGLSRVKTLLTFWVVVHAYLAGYGLLHSGRGPGSFLGDENDLALALNVALPYAFYLQRCELFSKYQRLCFLGAAVLIAAGVVATNSRGGFVGLAVTVVLLIWFSKDKFRNGLIVAVLAGVFYLMVPAEYKEEIQSISDTQDQTRQGRIFQWGLGWDMYLDNPIIGVGTGNYPWRVLEYEVQAEDFDPNKRLHGGRAAHSMYFTLIPEQGTVGSFIFLSILWIVVRRLLQIMRACRKQFDDSIGGYARLLDASARSTMVSLAAFLVTGVFISVLYYPPYWYAIGLTYIIWAECCRLRLVGVER